MSSIPDSSQVPQSLDALWRKAFGTPLEQALPLLQRLTRDQREVLLIIVLQGALSPATPFIPESLEIVRDAAALASMGLATYFPASRGYRATPLGVALAVILLLSQALPSIEGRAL
jgi:hypothetical protein